jgi:hypothetical protein
LCAKNDFRGFGNAFLGWEMDFGGLENAILHAKSDFLDFGSAILRW